MCVYGSDKVIKYLHINITFLVYLLVTNADIETKKSKLVKSRDLKKKSIDTITTRKLVLSPVAFINIHEHILKKNQFAKSKLVRK